MGAHALDLTGQRFGRLVAIQRVESPLNDGQAYWLCQCDCGNTKIVRTSHLTAGDVKSCGCLRLEAFEKGREPRHNDCGTSLYQKWASMKHRCNNPNAQEYDRYGGRGITVCDDWQKYENFRDWALEHGYEESLSIDRINNDGNYEPDNCRFASRIQQQNNMSKNVYYSMNGEAHTLSEWSRITGIDRSTLYSRLVRGMTFEQAISTPLYG